MEKSCEKVVARSQTILAKAEKLSRGPKVVQECSSAAQQPWKEGLCTTETLVVLSATCNTFWPSREACGKFSTRVAFKVLLGWP